MNWGGVVDRREGEIVPDGVTGSQSNPLWNWSVLLLGSGELNLRTERLVTLYRDYLVSILLLTSKFAASPIHLPTGLCQYSISRLFALGVLIKRIVENDNLPAS